MCYMSGRFLPIMLPEFCRFPARKLGQHNGGKHDDTAGDLPAAQPLPQDDPACQYGDTGFQAEDQRRDGGVHSLLADDLQSVGDAAGQDARIENRNPGRKQTGDPGILQKESRDAGQDAAHGELDAGHFHSVGER